MAFNGERKFNSTFRSNFQTVISQQERRETRYSTSGQSTVITSHVTTSGSTPRLRSFSENNNSDGKLPILGSSSNLEPFAIRKLSADATPFTRPPPTYRSAFNPSNTVGNYGGTVSSQTRRPVLPTNFSTTENPRTNYSPALTKPLSSSRHSLTESGIPTYPIKGPVLKGKALIINNVKFLEKGLERKGAEKDGNDLQKLFKRIGISTTYKQNLKGQEMQREVARFSQSSFNSHDISVVVMMSHGTNRSNADGLAVRGGYTEISGIDNDRIPIDEVIDRFVANTSNGLEGKPKIFFFQCCRGESDQIQADAILASKRHSDVLLAFSTLPGFLSNRDPEKGSWYIQGICEVFDKHYKDHHVEDMLKLVDQTLSNKHPKYKQTSTYESRGFKRCYLYPKKL